MWMSTAAATLEPLDVLLVINGLNNNSSGEGERSNVEQSWLPIVVAEASK